MNSDDTHIDFSGSSPGFFRRIAAMFYDWVLLIAVILVAVTVFTMGTDLVFGQNASHDLLQNPVARLFYQLYLVAVSALFYAWFWTHGGQTLGMKVWKLKIVDQNLDTPGLKQALLRLFYIILSCIPAGLGFFWMLFNDRNLTLYDSLSKTRLIIIDSKTVSSAGE